MALESEVLPVLASCEFVMQHARHVVIDSQGVKNMADVLVPELAALGHGDPSHGWDRQLHFFDGGPLTLQYLLCVDALNFCFWGDSEFEYEHLAKGLRDSLREDPHCLDADRLAGADAAYVRRLLRWPRDLPLQDERARLLREVGSGLARHFGGRAAALVAAARGSAPALVALVAAHFPGFRDHAVYRGRQVFLYKRAQIFAADVHGAFGGRGLGALEGVGGLTCFADYRVPVVLRARGVLRYDGDGGDGGDDDAAAATAAAAAAPAGGGGAGRRSLAARVDAGEEIPAGSEEEVEIRAATVVAVERLREEVASRLAAQGAPRAGDGGEAGGAAESASSVLSIHIDWCLWGIGERARDTDPPHHKTLTIYY